MHTLSHSKVPKPRQNVYKYIPTAYDKFINPIPRDNIIRCLYDICISQFGYLEQTYPKYIHACVLV